jgi:hypothetical protein
MGVDTLIVTAASVAAVTLSFMFVPSVIELTSPKDPGPRFIEALDATHALSIANMEEEILPDSQLPGRLIGLLRAVPGLEQSI